MLIKVGTISRLLSRELILDPSFPPHLLVTAIAIVTANRSPTVAGVLLSSFFFLPAHAHIVLFCRRRRDARELLLLRAWEKGEGRCDGDRGRGGG